MLRLMGRLTAYANRVLGVLSSHPYEPLMGEYGVAEYQLGGWKNTLSM